MLPEDIHSAGPDLDLAHANNIPAAVATPQANAEQLRGMNSSIYHIDEAAFHGDIPEVEVDPQAPVTHAADVVANTAEPEMVGTGEAFDDDLVEAVEHADADIDGAGDDAEQLPPVVEGSKDVVVPFEDMSLETTLAKIDEAYATITSGGEHTRAVLAGLHQIHPRANTFPEEGIQGYKFASVHGANSDVTCLKALITYIKNTLTVYNTVDTPTVLLSIDMRCHGEADRYLEIMVEWLTLVMPDASMTQSITAANDDTAAAPATDLSEHAVPVASVADIQAAIHTDTEE